MRIATRVLRGAGVAMIVGAMALAAGCNKHENFPAELDVVVPPTPSNFVITNPQGTDYDLSWQISDAAAVKNYRLYLVGSLGLAPELLAEPATTTFPITLSFDATGLRFGISAVSVDNVEGNMTTAVVP
jgi:hypothetical protein